MSYIDTNKIPVTSAEDEEMDRIASRAGSFDLPKDLPVSFETIKHIELVPVESTSGHILAVGYDAEREWAVIKYKNDTYLYPGTAPDLGADLITSASSKETSTGALANANFRNRPFHKIANILDRAETNDTLASEASVRHGRETASEYRAFGSLDEPAVRAELPEFPTEFLAEFTKGQIDAREVKEVLSFFRSEVSLADFQTESRAIVVTDASQVDLMKQARKLRLRLQSARLVIEEQRKEHKEPHLRKVQAIDGTAKILKDMLAAEEAYLKEQETFVERAEAKRLDEIEADRIKQLDPYIEGSGLTHAGFGNIRGMSDQIFATVLAGAKAAFELRQEEEAKTQNLLRTLQRERQLSALGFIANPDTASHYFRELVVKNSTIEDSTDEDWSLVLGGCAAQVEMLNAEAKTQAAADLAERERLNSEAAAALIAKQKAEDELKARQDADDAEAARIADEKAKEAAAPDREKFQTYLLKLRDSEAALRPQDFATPDANVLANRFFDDFSNLINEYATEAAGLKAVSEFPF